MKLHLENSLKNKMQFFSSVCQMPQLSPHLLPSVKKGADLFILFIQH